MIATNDRDGPELARPRILLAEDDPMTSGLVIEVLTHHGFEVIAATDGEEALGRVRCHRPDAIILDAMMPGLDGFQVLQSLRTTVPTLDLPVMMLTARSLEQDVVNGFAFGADDYVTKPFRPAELVARLKRLLRLRQDRYVR
jgi:DNA-binding response OmpR family regulator